MASASQRAQELVLLSKAKPVDSIEIDDIASLSASA
jgi:hypothetical protein